MPRPMIAVPEPPAGKVTITTQTGESLTCWVDGVAKILPAAFGGYGSTERPGRRARTTYQGVDVVGMTVPLLLDGWAARKPVGPDKRRLEAMASPRGKAERTPPQPVLVIGSVPISGRWWVIQALEPGDNVRLRPDGALLRQDYVMTVIDPPDDAIIVTNGKRYTVRKGDTLITIAARQLGKASRWREIRDSKGRRIRDPKSVKPGQVVRLP